MIKLSRMADYGVILMTQLARENGAVTTAAELAASCALPPPTVSKLLKELAQEGLLESRRGTKGGYALARPAENISMAALPKLTRGLVIDREVENKKIDEVVERIKIKVARARIEHVDAASKKGDES